MIFAEKKRGLVSATSLTHAVQRYSKTRSRSRIRHPLDTASLKTPIHCPSLTILNCCNSIRHGLSDCILLLCLTRTQHQAARTVSRTLEPRPYHTCTTIDFLSLRQGRRPRGP